MRPVGGDLAWEVMEESSKDSLLAEAPPDRIRICLSFRRGPASSNEDDIVNRSIRGTSCLLLAWVLVALLSPAATAQSFTQLQILLPGEQPAPGTTSGKLGTPDDQVVGSTFTVRLRACDADWNTVTSVAHLISLSSTDAVADLPDEVTLSAGEATFQATLNASGSFTFGAADETDPTIPDASSANVTTLFLQGFEFDRISQKNQNAGQPLGITLRAIDPSGSVVTGFDGTVALQQLTSFGDGRIEPASVQLQNGVWSGDVTMYRADETSINRGNVNIYALLPIDPTRNGTSDPFTVHPGNFSRVQIVLPGEAAAPGSVNGVLGSPASQGADDAFVVDVYGTDDYWNPVPTMDTVRITSSDPAASTPVNATLNNGAAQATVRLSTVGTQTLSISDLTNGSIQGMTSAPVAVTSGAVDQFVIEGIVGPITAGNAVDVTIRAADAAGNTITEYQGDGVLTANTGPGSISPTGVNFVDGVWTGPIQFRGAGGAVQLSCSDYSSPPHTGTSPSFEVVSGPYVGLQVLAPSQTAAGGTADGATGSPDEQSSGSGFNVRVRAVDAFWNRVPGTNARVVVSSSDAFATVPDTTALNDGEAVLPVTLFAAGEQTVHAVDADSSGTIAEGISDPIPVVAGAYARIVLVAPGEVLAPGTEEGRSGEATDQSINFAFTVQVYATDEWGNPLTGITDEIALTSNDPLAELPSPQTMVDGVADLVLRLSTGGFQQITATNLSSPSMPPSTTQVRAISSGLHLEAELSTTSIGAGEPFSLTVKVTNDAGSVIQEINSFVDIEVRNASSQDPGRGTLLNTQFQLLQGQRTISETYTFAEDIVLVVRDDAGNAPAVTEVLTVTPGVPAVIQLSSNPSWVRGGRFSTIDARVVDAFDNGVPAQPLQFSIAQGLGSIEAIDLETDDVGVGQARFQAPPDPEIGAIQVTSGALSAELEIEIALVDPNAPGGTVTNYPNPFFPGENPTTIAYKLSDPANVRLRIYTLMGNLVYERDFVAGDAGGRAGLNEFAWDGRNGDGDTVASGGYVLLIEANGNGETLHVMKRKIGVVR